MAKWVDFKTVREHLNFRDVLAHYGIEEHGKGDQIEIVCPFHGDHKPSCGVNLKNKSTTVSPVTQAGMRLIS